MYRSVLALLFASVLLLSGCAAERQRIPREKDTQGTDMAGQSSDMSGEKGMYKRLHTQYSSNNTVAASNAK